MEKKFLNNYQNNIITALFALSLFFILFLPIDYYLTEIKFTIGKINPLINTGILFLFLLIANFFDWQSILNKKRGKIIFVLLFLASFTLYGLYREIKIERENLPKIINVSSARFIQGEIIEIDGINFVHAYEKGKVFVGNTEYQTQDWSNAKIFIEAPVPCKFGHFNLYVKNKEGKISNSISVETYDPASLNK